MPTCPAGENNKGFKTAYRVWRETVFNELPTPTVVGLNIPYDSNSIKGSQAIIENNAMNGTRKNNTTGLGAKSVAGSIPVPFENKASLFWFYMALSWYTKQGALNSGKDYEQDIAVWNAITDGEFTVSIDGTSYDVTGLDFSSATDLVDVAQVIEDELQVLLANTTFEFDNLYPNTTEKINSFFVLKSPTIEDEAFTTAVSQLTAVSGGTGTDITALLDMGTNGIVCSYRYFEPRDCIPSFGAEKVFQQQYYLHTGLKVNQLGFSFSGEATNRSTLTVDVVGSNSVATDATSTTSVSTAISDGLLFNDFEVKIVVLDTNLVTELSRGFIKTCNLTLANGVTPQQILDGKNYAKFIDEGKLTISGDMGVIFKQYADSFLKDATEEVLLPIKIYIRKFDSEVVLFLKDAKFEVTEPEANTVNSVEYTINFGATDIQVTHKSTVGDII